ncbi:MAG TPA: hypothetical protein VG146_07570 [Verrucomicrobiae bacterium]|nr:hypothetical protein [Verrucomicrobiae bacterium]
MPPLSARQPRLASTASDSQLDEVASRSDRPGVVWDYFLVYDWPGFQFSCYYTYLVDGPCHLANADFDPGTAVKFSPGASLFIDGPLYCHDQSSGGQDVNLGDRSLLTSANDDSVGEVIDGSNGQPFWGDSGRHWTCAPSISTWRSIIS